MPIIDILKPKAAGALRRIPRHGHRTPCLRGLLVGIHPRSRSLHEKVVAGGSKLWVNSLWASLCGGLRRCGLRRRSRRRLREARRHGGHDDPDRPSRTADILPPLADCTTDAMSRITDFYRISPAAPAREHGRSRPPKYYRRLRMQAFIAATLGYSLYYVCRTSLNVMKKPILDSGSFDASQLGVIGSALLCSPMPSEVRKRIHRRLLQHQALHGHGTHRLGCRKRPDGTAHGARAFRSSHGRDIRCIRRHVGTERMGAVHGSASRPSYPSRGGIPSRNGTYYGFFSASHNLGEFFSFLFVGSIVTFAGWQAGFFGSALAGAIGVVIVLCWLHDTPESKGLPPVEALAHEKPAPGAENPFGRFKNKCSAPRTYGCWRRQAHSCTYPDMP